MEIQEREFNDSVLVEADYMNDKIHEQEVMNQGVRDAALAGIADLQAANHITIAEQNRMQFDANDKFNQRNY